MECAPRREILEDNARLMNTDGKKIIDITMPLVAGSTPTWPGSPGLSVEYFQAIPRGDRSNNTQLTMDVHVGTHLEGSLHFVDGGESVDTIALAMCVGEAYVVDCTGRSQVGAADLAACNIPDDCTRLLLKTENSARWNQGKRDFDEALVGLTADGAAWVVEHGIQLIGNDYLSISARGQASEVHATLFDGGVAVLEGVVLADVDPGTYTLVCLPLSLPKRESAPARAVLIKS